MGACSSSGVDDDDNGAQSHVVIGAKKGPSAVLAYNPKTLTFTGQALTENTDAHYVRLSGDTLFSLHPYALSASTLAAKDGAVLPLAQAKTGKGATAVEVMPGGSVVFTAHFPDKRLTVRNFDGTAFSQPQEFPCSEALAVFNINPDTGAVVQPPKQTIATTVDGAMNRSSDIHISPDGGRVYAFNRVNQDMAVFDVAADRTLKRSAIVPMGFGEVRDWAMAPDGDYIITASNEGHVGLWAIDPDTGYLTLSDARSGLGNAVTVAIVE